MSHLVKRELPDGRNVWIDKHGLIRAPVRSGNSHEDEKEERERVCAEAFVSYLQLPGSLDRPAGHHDFDLLGDGSVALSIEVKELTFPTAAMSSLAQQGEAAFGLSALEEEIRRDLSKAASQLQPSAGERRAILICWGYEESPNGWLSWLHANIARITDELGIEYEVWFTMSHARSFEHLS